MPCALMFLPIGGAAQPTPTPVRDTSGERQIVGGTQLGHTTILDAVGFQSLPAK